MRDAGGQPSGNGELFRAAKGFLGFRVLEHLIANLILALAAAQSDFQRAEQGFWAYGAFKEEEIAQGLAQLTEALAFNGHPSADGKENQGEVGPGWLLIQGIYYLGDGVVL
jgi:hypothetical protein